MMNRDDCAACGHDANYHLPPGIFPRAHASTHCRLKGCDCVQYEKPPACEQCGAPLDAEGKCPDPQCRRATDVAELTELYRDDA